MAKKNRKKNTLLYILAHGSTQDAQDLLEKNTGQRAKDYNDLEYKLAEYYSKSQNKIEVEKEFAEIHPHKDFILKYLSPKENIENVKSTVEDFSNCQGEPNCNCNKITKEMSGFNGIYSPPNYEKPNNTMVICVLGVVAILGLVVIYKK